MKNIIYLSIVAVVMLCSCKGSSYLHQRYTHFAHGPSKKAAHEPTAKKTVMASQQVAARFVAAEQDPGALAPQEPLVLTAEQVTEGGKDLKARPLKHVKQLLLDPVKAAKARTILKNQETKADAGAAQEHRGLLSGLIGLILYIVLSAVVIAAIIILVLIII